ncbi:hypothetical protein OCT63_19730 [Vibrio sp. RW]|uniref:hypothetical protein n=1 Tax=Vibrio sp. RW TaxID=2998833 RepID=UPI0022CDA1DA|nr:hypothetical protein [Vibrio sp. RW]MDA0146461.1 hypothetical protein [Vibrio sp. RW]
MINLAQQKLDQWLEDQPHLAAHASTYDVSEVERAFHGQSQHPESRAVAFIADFAARIHNFEETLRTAVTETLKKSVKTTIEGDPEVAIAEQVKYFKDALKKKTDENLHAESQCVSWHVTGPANFNVRRSEAKNKRARDTVDNIMEFCEKAVKGAKKRLFPEGDGSCIKLSSSNPSVALEAEIASCKLAHEWMKIANRLVPAAYKKAESDTLTTDQEDELKQKLLDKGIPEDQISIYMEPNPIKATWGRFSTQNSLAKIKRLEGRLIEAKRVEETRETGGLEGEIENGITYGLTDGRIAIWLGGRPPKEITSKLRKFAFKFSPSRNNAWVRAHTANAEIVFNRDVLPFLKELDTSSFT